MPLSQPSKVILTGGTSGIGAEMLDLLLAAGHEVIVLARRASQLEPRNGLEAIDIDLSDSASVKAVVAKIAARHGNVAVLINNAALQYPVALTDPEFDPLAMQAEVAINLVAPALLIHQLLAGMLRRGAGAAVVNISSGLAFFPKRQTALYCATKAALHSFSQSLRYQLEGSGISVIEVILPLVDTPMTEGRGRGKLSSSDAADQIIAGVKRGQSEIYVGKAKLIPLLLRVAPWVLRKALKGS